MGGAENDSQKYLEVFVRCSALDLSLARESGTFVVLLKSSDEGESFVEISRTETVPNVTAPQYCTSFQFEYDSLDIGIYILRFDLYVRKNESTERLTEQRFLGRVTVSLATLLSAPGNHHTAHLAGLSQGVLSISAEHVDMSNPEMESTVEIDVRAAVLRKRDWHRSFIPQRYELRRAHRHDDPNEQPVWLPIYRSDRISKHRDSSATYVDFSRASFSYRHLCNGDDERTLRFIMSSGSTRRGGPEGDIGFVEFTLRDICEIDPTEDVFNIERDDMSEDVGHIRVLEAEPTDYGSHFGLLLNHASCDKYVSAIENPDTRRQRRTLSKRIRFPKSRSSLVSSGPSSSMSPRDLFGGEFNGGSQGVAEKKN